MCRSYSHIWYGIEPHFTIPCSLRTSLSRFSQIFYWRNVQCCWIVSMWAGQHSFLWWSHSNNTQALTVSRPPALPRKTWICFRIKKQLVPLDILQIQMAQIHPNPFPSPKITNKLQQQQEHELEKPTIYILYNGGKNHDWMILTTNRQQKDGVLDKWKWANKQNAKA